MNIEEKVIILASLFSDIGKFQQSCTRNPDITKLKELSVLFINENKNQFLKILDNDSNAYEKLTQEISLHHSTADKSITHKNWEHIYLSSLFSKVRLNNNTPIQNHYFTHSALKAENFQNIIPKFDNENEALNSGLSFNEDIWNNFKKEINYFLSNFQNDEDFQSLITMILFTYEKYLWSIPDFTDTKDTDISLFNNIKDATALAHCIFLSGEKNKNLYLVVGDIPGIQNYIFSVIGKPAKMLRGRSLYVQLLSRVFSSLYLKEFGLTETNIIMLAGGKFYILCPDVNDFEDKFKKVKCKIEKYLFTTHNMKLRYNAGFCKFDREKLLNKEITFGDVIEEANASLQNNKLTLFEEKLFKSDFNYILKDGFLDKSVNDKDNLKCYLTGDPILKDEGDIIKVDDEDKNVSHQAKREYEAGEKVVSGNMLAEIDDEMNIRFFNLKDYKGNNNYDKIIINPNSEITKEYTTEKTYLFRNTYFMQVANYASKNKDGGTVDFKDIEEDNGDSAKYLTLIKGDIDNLGLIMALGLIDDDKTKNLNAISRITTMSYHLKYFFSYYFNGFLKKYEQENSCKLYTIFAGGDDLMIICPQRFALDLLKKFNESFTTFVCNNEEIHISYSITQFKNSTPIKFVSEISEENQEKAKNNSRQYSPDDSKYFSSSNNKASFYLHNTIIKNSLINNIIKDIELLEKWYKEEKISMGIIRNLLMVSENMKDYREKRDPSKLMWHPLLTYQINRLLKKDCKYPNTQIEEYFETVLSINKDSKESKEKELILYPSICSTIYKLRNF